MLRQLFVLAAVWLMDVTCARADEGVLLFERPGLRPGLCAALRIQLADVADVRCEAEPSSDDLSARIGRGAARVREEHARLGLLLERDPDPGLVRMYVVAARGDEAVVAIERVQDRPEPDVDRSLALKVRDAFEVVERTAPELKDGAPQGSLGLAAVVAPTPEPLPAALGPADPPADQRSTALWLEAGPGVNLGTSARALGTIAAGVARSTGELRTELGLGVRQLSRARERNALESVEESERGPYVTLRALWAKGRIQTGGTLELTMWLSNAQGETHDGARAERTQLLWAIAPGLDLRVRLFASAFVRFAPALEILAPRQHFAVNGHTLLDLGRVRAVVPLSLFLSLPLGGRP